MNVHDPAGLLFPGVPEMPWHLQILADQLTLPMDFFKTDLNKKNHHGKSFLIKKVGYGGYEPWPMGQKYSINCFPTDSKFFTGKGY